MIEIRVEQNGVKSYKSAIRTAGSTEAVLMELAVGIEQLLDGMAGEVEDYGVKDAKPALVSALAMLMKEIQDAKSNNKACCENFATKEEMDERAGAVAKEFAKNEKARRAN